jgi:hypothetical protein
MNQPEPFLKLGLDPAPPPSAVPAENVPAVNTLQFRRADAVSDSPIATGPACVSCKQSIVDSYFHVQGQVACPNCASAIIANQKAPPAHSLLKAALYGLGAALAGCAIYAAVAILTGLELALIAILIGYMVGTAIRKASGGLGGRPQQILAVLLTYFAITTSYIPVGIYHYIQNPHRQASAQATSAAGADTTVTAPQKPRMSFGGALVAMLLLALAAPFMGLSQGVGAILSIVIIFFGLQRAWRIAGRHDLLIMGPYNVQA